MQLAMMDSADRNGELVAHASSECTRLCKREVMRIDGTRPHTRQGCRSTNPRCFLSRRRTVLPQSTIRGPGFGGSCFPRDTRTPLKERPRQQYSVAVERRTEL